MQKRSTIQLIFGVVLLLVAPLLAAESYYRWQDSQGVQHYTDERPPEGTAAEQLTIDSGNGFYRVTRVIDGDTVVLENGNRVRLIGLNTPEVAHRNQPADPGGDVASDYLQELIEGKLVRLEYGAERYDKYRRVLAHIFTKEGKNINAMILAEGFAHAVVKLPNVRLIDQYFSAESEARESGRGIWLLPQFKIYPIEAAKNFRNSFRRLRGVVKRTEEKRSAWMFYFKGGVKALLRKEHLAPFVRSGRAPQQLVGKLITIRGWVHQSKGAPLIRLYHPRMIETIESGR
ncbi:MAG: thermonuclease family protein [Chromatiales bacterium]|nr:thermonuclease family protein [Chromatiales bacterium]